MRTLPVLVAVLSCAVLSLAGCAASLPSAPPAPDPSAASPSAAAPSTASSSAEALAVGTAQLPSEVIDLSSWNLTLPTGADGEPDVVYQPDLARYSSDWFRLDDTRRGVVFTADVGGTTTKGTDYPRSELREMDGADKAAWSNDSGVHVLRARQAVTVLPPVKPHVVTAQIHDGEDDVMEVRLEGSRLLAQYDDGDRDVTLDPDYLLGTPFDLEIVATAGRIVVHYAGATTATATIERSGSGWFFKAGSYVQSNPERGDTADAVGAVVIYALDVQHTS